MKKCRESGRPPGLAPLAAEWVAADIRTPAGAAEVRARSDSAGGFMLAGHRAPLAWRDGEDAASMLRGIAELLRQGGWCWAVVLDAAVVMEGLDRAEPGRLEVSFGPCRLALDGGGSQMHVRPPPIFLAHTLPSSRSLPAGSSWTAAGRTRVRVFPVVLAFTYLRPTFRSHSTLTLPLTCARSSSLPSLSMLTSPSRLNEWWPGGAPGLNGIDWRSSIDHSTPIDPSH
jgi:hypothetical protein